MINIKKIYEDALAAVASTNNIGGSSSIITTDISKNNDGIIVTDDVLGKCDHDEGGYMKDGCFHLPKGSEKIQKREIFAGKKKKNHKNDYIKGMKVIEDEQ